MFVVDDEFPSADSLRAANCKFGEAKLTYNSEDGLPAPRPAAETKDELFQLDSYTNIDKRACEVHAAAYEYNIPLSLDFTSLNKLSADSV